MLNEYYDMPKYVSFSQCISWYYSISHRQLKEDFSWKEGGEGHGFDDLLCWLWNIRHSQ